MGCIVDEHLERLAWEQRGNVALPQRKERKEKRLQRQLQRENEKYNSTDI